VLLWADINHRPIFSGGVRPAPRRSSLLQIRPQGGSKGGGGLMTNTRSPCTVTTVRPRWVLGLTSIACFMVALDSLVVVTALPPMPQGSALRPRGPASSKSQRMHCSCANPTSPGGSMTTEPTLSPDAARLERTYDARAKLIWDLLTTAVGLEEWWAPHGFETRVTELELRPGGQLRYTMTATAPEQVAFMQNTGNPLSIELRKTFTEVAPPTRLAYLSLIDFVSGHEPYQHLTTIDIEPAGDRTTVVLTLNPLHDETWTQEYRAHRSNELGNLEVAIKRRTM
jgi:uncharacterized protein YndB with AHSA1/START domain